METWFPIVRDLSPETLLGVCILLIVFGVLVPRPFVKVLMREKDATIGHLLEANRILRRNNEALLRNTASTTVLLEATETKMAEADCDDE